MSENEAAGLDFRPAGGESPRDVQDRLLPWLAGLRGPTVAVTHKGVIRALYCPGHGLVDARQGRAQAPALRGAHASRFRMAA